MSNSNLPVRNVATLNEFFDAQTDTISALLPSGMDISFLRANVLAAVSANPKLLDCTRSSLYQSIFEAGELGLMVHSVLGEAWIVPYKNKATLIVGYQGLTKLAYNGGFLRKVESRAVFSNDEFRCVYGIDPELYLVENHAGRGSIIGVYCLIELTTGGKLFEFYPIEKLEEIRAKSAAYKYKPNGEIWGDEHNTMEMYRKAVWRNASKWIPRSGTRYAKALDVDERDYTGYYDQDHDAEERLYKAVGVIEAPKEESKEEDDRKVYQIMFDELNFLFDDIFDDAVSDEVYDLIELILAKPNTFTGNMEPSRPDDIDLMTLDQFETITTMIRRAKKFLIGKRMTSLQGQDRVLRFFRFCMLNQFLLNTTRNLDAARSAFVEDEKANG